MDGSETGRHKASVARRSKVIWNGKGPIFALITKCGCDAAPLWRSQAAHVVAAVDRSEVRTLCISFGGSSDAASETSEPLVIKRGNGILHQSCKVSIIASPWKTAMAWHGDQLDVGEAASGTVLVKPSETADAQSGGIERRIAAVDSVRGPSTTYTPCSAEKGARCCLWEMLQHDCAVATRGWQMGVEVVHTHSLHSNKQSTLCKFQHGR